MGELKRRSQNNVVMVELSWKPVGVHEESLTQPGGIRDASYMRGRPEQQGEFYNFGPAGQDNKKA